MELDLHRNETETEVGSYFVANYPPFSLWTPDQVAAAEAALDAPCADRATTPLGLYLHIPFCRTRCKFCYFRVYTDKNSKQVEDYLDALCREVELYADRPGLAGRSFEFVYFGGGTPSFLSSAQLERLVGSISRRWRWDDAREVTFECEPGTLKKSKLETIKQIGTTRLSLGVEHFNDEILQLNGRAHKSPEILQAYQWAREVGFDQINVDLIAGMMGDTEDGWRDTVDKTLALDPDCVTIYQMEVPHNSLIAQAARGGAGQVPVASWATKRAWVDEAFSRFEDAGYVVSSGYTLVKPGERSSFVYRDSVWHGADMIGMGVASFSHFAGMHYQNLDQWSDYIDTIRDGRLPIARALPATEQQLLIRELILQLKLGRVDLSYFRGKFGVEVRDESAEALDRLSDEGMLTIDKDEIRLTRAGLLRVDALLPGFFEPQHRGVRYT
jgi:oxygen-independent coproporphyrinogen-3 oxidase